MLQQCGDHVEEKPGFEVVSTVVQPIVSKTFPSRHEDTWRRIRRLLPQGSSIAAGDRNRAATRGIAPIGMSKSPVAKARDGHRHFGKQETSWLLDALVYSLWSCPMG